MNLVDAIRQASAQRPPGADAPIASAATLLHLEPAPKPVRTESAPKLEVYEAPEAVAPKHDATPAEDQPPSETPPVRAAPREVAKSKEQFVRIELYLNPEQMHGLLKETIGAQRSILTVREVAQMLRTTSHNVERLATEGKLPAFRLDDSWRFSRSALEDWMASQTESA